MLPPCLWAFLGVSMNLMGTLQGPWEVGMEGVVMTITNTLAFAPAPPCHSFSKKQPERPFQNVIQTLATPSSKPSCGSQLNEF